jgi:hypothetical protein
VSLADELGTKQGNNFGYRWAGKKKFDAKKKRQKGRTVLDVVVFINVSKLLQSPA